MGDTYPLVPNRIIESVPQFKTTIVSFEDGTEQRGTNWSENKTAFKLSHEALNTERLKILTDFFKEKKGAFRKFYFVNHHDGFAYEVRFASDKLSIQTVTSKIFNVDVELITC